MSQRRSFTERAIKRIRPRLDTTFHPAPCELASDLWVLDRRLRMPGGAILPNRSTIVRLRERSLVVISPPPLVSPDDTLAIDAIGDVRYVVIPNSFHYVYAAAFLARYPRAALLTAAAVAARVPDLPAGQELDPKALPEAWKSELELAVLGPVHGISETVFFHCATRTLILTDLAFHMTRFDRSFDRIAWRLSGVPRAFGPSRTARQLLLRDVREAAPFLERVAKWPFERIVVAHGDVVEDDAQARFRSAYAGYLGQSTK